MTRKDIIEFLKKKKVEFNPTLRLPDLEALYKKHSGDVVTSTDPIPPVSSEPTGTQPQPKSEMAQLMEMMGTVVKKVGDIDSRLSKVEGPNGNEFKNNTKAEDVEFANNTKSKVDDRVVRIVEETLGVDFGIDLETFEDKPGFLFTVIVPQRLSDMPPSTRPVVDPETGKYKVQSDGKTPLLEDYIPQDRRSRAIGSAQSYEAIREHCNRVRSYIVSYYTKASKPVPEFKLKETK